MTHGARSIRAAAGVRPGFRPYAVAASWLARSPALGWITIVTLALFGAAAAQEEHPGQAVYERVCSSCHLDSGEGIEGTYPALIGSSVVTGEEDGLIRRILNGGGGMPAFAPTLGDDEIADVASYVRTAWGNDAGQIDAEVVAEVREAEGADAGPDAEADAEADTEAEATPDFEWQELGATVFSSSCAACHQADGQGLGSVYPALAGNGFVQGDAVEVVRTVLYGRAGMPSYDGDLDDERMAAVVSYIRNSWDNEAPVVTPEFVQDVRGGATDAEPTDPSYRPGAAN